MCVCDGTQRTVSVTVESWKKLCVCVCVCVCVRVCVCADPVYTLRMEREGERHQEAAVLVFGTNSLSAAVFGDRKWSRTDAKRPIIIMNLNLNDHRIVTVIN